MEVVAKLPSTDQRDSELRQVLKALGAFRRGEAGVCIAARTAPAARDVPAIAMRKGRMVRSIV